MKPAEPGTKPEPALEPGSMRSPEATGWRLRLRHLAAPERRPMVLALLLSLLIHALLLSLSFGEGLGLPGFDLPWRERRVEAPELRVVLLAPRVAVPGPSIAAVANPPPRASIEQPAATGQPVIPSVSTARLLRPEAEGTVPNDGPAATAPPKADIATGAADAKPPLQADRPDDAEPPRLSGTAVIEADRSDTPTWVVPPAPLLPLPFLAAAPSASSPEPLALAPRRADDEARERVASEAREQAVERERSRQEAERQAALLEAARIEASEAARLEAARQAEIRREAAQQEAARREAARVEIARLEAERQEAVRQAAIRQEAAQQESARQEAARVEAARSEAERQEALRQAEVRQEAAKQEAARREAARLEAERQDAVRQSAARQEAAKLQAQDAAERREAARRALGRQLDEEADRRDAVAAAARQGNTLPSSLSTARRGRLFGRTDPNAELILYAEAWARKIQLNTTPDMLREATKRPHTHPLVTVAIRRDGSVESLTFVTSSGVAEIDEAIRRIVESQLPYRTFPPGLAREFDVIEIRRTWSFDTAVRLD